jgi:hypothetical protein
MGDEKLHFCFLMVISNFTYSVHHLPLQLVLNGNPLRSLGEPFLCYWSTSSSPLPTWYILIQIPLVCKSRVVGIHLLRALVSDFTQPYIPEALLLVVMLAIMVKLRASLTLAGVAEAGVDVT